MLFLSVLLFGCPLPPGETTNDGPKIMNSSPKGKGGSAPSANGGGNTMGKPAGAPPNVGGDMQDQAGGQGGGTPSAGGAGTQGPSGKPGGVLMDMEQMKAQRSQEQIETLEHVTISGVIEGECTGILRLDAIGTEDLGGPQDGGEMKGPISTKVLETVGEFTLLIPKGSSVNVAALCDGDGNNKITADVDQLSLGARLGVVDDDVSDVTLTLEAIKPPSGDLPPEKPMNQEQ